MAGACADHTLRRPHVTVVPMPGVTSSAARGVRRRARPSLRALPVPVAVDLLLFLDARDLCRLQGTCTYMRDLARRNCLWGTLYARHYAGGRPPKVPGGARVAVAQDYWWRRFRRQSRGEALIIVHTLCGSRVPVSVLASDDKWSVKRRVRAAQRRVDGFQLRDFQLRDIHTGALFGVRGDSMLPPNSLHQVVLHDLLPLGDRVRAWRDSLTQRNTDWLRTMDTLVDGTTFVQEVFGSNGANSATGRASADADVAMSGRTAQGQGRWSTDRVLALAQPGGLDLDATSCLDALRHSAVSNLIECAQDARHPRRRRDMAAFALIRLLRTASVSFSREAGPRAWKIGFTGPVHPLLRLAWSGRCGWRARVQCVRAWVAEVLREMLSLRLLRDVLVRATVMWGAPALVVRLLTSMPRAVGRALSGWKRAAEVATMPTEVFGVLKELADTMVVATAAAAELTRALKPHLATAFAYETAVAAVHSTLRVESRWTQAAAAVWAAVGAGCYGAAKKSKYAVWRSVRGALLSAMLWEAVATRVGAPKLILGMVSVYGASWWALLAYIRVRVALVFEAD